MRKFSVIGMSCAACSARVEKAVNNIETVKICNVNLLTNSMTVEGSASDDDIINAVRNAGYDAKPYEMPVKKKKAESEKIKKLIVSVFLLLILMYFSMGYAMWHFPIPQFLNGNYFVIGIIEAVLSLCILILNRNFFINGFKGVFHLSPNMDTLVSMGAGVSYIYSLYLLIMMYFSKAVPRK